MFNSSDENYFSYQSLCKGFSTDEKYFITITSRKDFPSKKHFTYALERVLFATRYPRDIYGYIECSEGVTGYHFHGYTTHKYNHFKRKSGWFAMVKKIDNLNAVTMYILKNSNKEI